MKISRKALKEVVKEAIRGYGNYPKPQPEIQPNRGPEREVITIPRRETDPDTIPTKRPNPLRPPKEAPDTKPKGLFEEGDEIIDKIAKRYGALKEQSEKRQKVGLVKFVNEVSISLLQQQFVDTEKIKQEVFDEIVSVVKNNSAFATWLVTKVEKGIIDPEDLYKYELYFEIFNKRKREFPKQNINDYKTPQDVDEFITAALDLESKYKERTGQSAVETSSNLVKAAGIAELQQHGIELLGLVDGYQCFKVPKGLQNNEAAWKAYRKHLAVCSGRGMDDAGADRISICTMGSMSHFNNYISQGPFYIFFNLKDNDAPYQFHYETNQFKNRKDVEII